MTVPTDRGLLGQTISLLAGHADEVFASGNPIFINRYALLTQLACLNAPSQMLAKCPYIFNFIEHSQYQSVCELFANFLVTSGGEKTLQLRRQLRDANFPGRLLDAISSANSTFDGTLSDPSAEMLTGVFKLISVVRADCELGLMVITEEALAILSKPLENAPVILLNAQWYAVECCLNKENCRVIEPRIDQLIDFLRSPGPAFHSYQSAQLSIISSLLSYLEPVRRHLLEINFPMILVELITRFPAHGIAHSAVTRFMFDHMNDGEFSIALVDAFVPLVIENMKLEASTILRAFAWNFQTKILQFGENSQLAQYVKERVQKDEAAAACFAALSEVIQTEYGGEVPEDAADGPPMMNPQLLMELLRRIAVAHRP